MKSEVNFIISTCIRMSSGWFSECLLVIVSKFNETIVSDTMFVFLDSLSSACLNIGSDASEIPRVEYMIAEQSVPLRDK